MEFIGEMSQMVFEFLILQGSGNWFSVCVKIIEGSVGLRVKVYFYC